MKAILNDALKNAMSYEAYRNLMNRLIDEKKSTGNTQSEDLLHYSELNKVRMNRVEKTTSVNDELIDYINQHFSKITWLVISEGWCGDAAQIVPVLQKIAAATPTIDFKIVLRDDKEALMNLFLTNGAKAIPILLILDEKEDFMGNWGPRPKEAKNLILNYKAKHGIVDEPAKILLQKWYSSNKGKAIQEEVLQTLKNLKAETV